MSMKSNTYGIMAALITAVLFSSASAYAAGGAKETFIRSKPHVNVGSIGNAPPLALDLVADSEGRLEGAITPLTGLLGNLTLKRGRVRAVPEGGIEAAVGAQIFHQARDGSERVSDLTMELQQSADCPYPPCNGDMGSDIIWDIVDSATAQFEPNPEWKYVPIRRFYKSANDSADAGDMLLFASTNPTGALAVEEVFISFVAQTSTDTTEQLWGEPAYLFNTPAPGEDLVAIIPMPLAGEFFEEELHIYSSERAEAAVVLTWLVSR